MNNSRTIHRRNGFTLVELLITIALLGALAIGLLATIDPFEQLKKGTDTTRQQVTNDVYNAAIQNYTSAGTFTWDNVAGVSLDSPTGIHILNAIIQTGELKKNFLETAHANLSSVYISSHKEDNSIVLCFIPASKSFKAIKNTVYDRYGQMVQICPTEGCYSCIGESSPNMEIADNTNNGQGNGSESQILHPSPQSSSTPTKATLPTAIPTSTTAPTVLPTTSPTHVPAATPTIQPTSGACIPPTTPPPPMIPFTNLPYNQMTSCPLVGASPAFADSVMIENGLELYKMEHGSYPDCACSSWANTEICLKDKISKYIPKFPITTTPDFPYLYQPYNATAGGYQSYCLAAKFHESCTSENLSCPLDGQSGYTYYRKGRGEVIWRPDGSKLTQAAKTANDQQRKNDLNQIKLAIENYKKDHGYIPQTTSPSPWNILFIKNLLQPAYINPMPYMVGSDFMYTIVEWAPDAAGKYQHYCVASYMDDSSNCKNTCSIWTPFYNAYYCYGIGD
jgi:prepilin-type N-terminal cleavage/methylation domain-containing protein